jgi:hypothetical protein
MVRSETADTVKTAGHATKQISPQSNNTTTTSKGGPSVHLRHDEEQHSDASSTCSDETVLYSENLVIDFNRSPEGNFGEELNASEETNKTSCHFEARSCNATSG